MYVNRVFEFNTMNGKKSKLDHFKYKGGKEENKQKIKVADITSRIAVILTNVNRLNPLILDRNSEIGLKISIRLSWETYKMK